MDMFEMFNFLHDGQLDLSRFNFGKIVWLPKTKQAMQIQQYRPICLLNVSFKSFNNVATHTINSVVDHVIRPSQTAFMQGRNILDGVVIPHETVDEFHRKNMSWVIFKIDFEKAYDKVK